MKKLYQCTCRFCGATFTRQVPNSTLCDNSECRRKAKAENDKKYRSTEKGQATRYKNRHTEKAKETRKRYEQTEAYKQRKNERAKIYRQEEHVQELDKARKLRYYYRKFSALRSVTVKGADFISFEDWKKLYSANTCYYCGAEISGRNKTVDHKIPISRGGTNKLDNLCMCCQSCNSKKHDKTEAEFKGVAV